MKNNKHRHCRREFIKAGAGACAFSMFAPSIVQGRELKDYPAYYLDDPDRGMGPAPLPPTRIYPDMDHATVGMAGVKRNMLGRLDFETVLAAVREAVEAAGGLEEIEPGQTVMIKPNMAGPMTIPGKGKVTTDPQVVRAVIRLVKERGAKVLVGDRGLNLKGIPKLPELTFAVSGIGQACKLEGATPYPWHLSEYVRFFPNKRHWKKGFRIPKILQDVDHLINLPILKNHEGTTAEFTCCLKSYVGVIHPDDRKGKGLDTFHAKNISEKIAESHLAVKPLINIVDAINIMVRGGPGSGFVQNDYLSKAAVFAKSDLVLASKDRVACDSVSLSVLKLHGAEKGVQREYVEKSVRDQVQLYYSAELGLGQAEPDMITIEDIKVPRFDEIKSNWV
jgi:uncharacterized protein (DUF362 family)